MRGSGFANDFSNDSYPSLTLFSASGARLINQRRPRIPLPRPAEDPGREPASAVGSRHFLSAFGRLSAATVFLADYRTPLIALSLGMNALGVVVIGRELIVARRAYGSSIGSTGIAGE